MCGKFHRELSNEAMAARLKLAEGALRTALSRAQVRLLAGVKALAPNIFRHRCNTMTAEYVLKEHQSKSRFGAIIGL